MNYILTYFLYFVIYSIIGWFVETVFVFCQTKKFVDRGFLIGPYIPIYGVGSILMILYLTQYKDNVITVFLLAVIVCSILEYLTSYIMEVLFKTRWWDYSNEKFNLNGRICGKNSILFGLGGIFVIYYIHPIILYLVNKFSNNIITIILMIVFMIDLIISLNVINKFKHTLSNKDLKKDSTIEFSSAVKEFLITNHKTLEKRLFHAFPNINFDKFIEIKNDIKEEIEEIKTDIKEELEEIKDDIIEIIKKDKN